MMKAELGSPEVLRGAGSELATICDRILPRSENDDNHDRFALHRVNKLRGLRYWSPTDSRRLPKILTPWHTTVAVTTRDHRCWVPVTSRSVPNRRMPPVGGTGQPGMLATIFKVCSSWRVELANRLEVLGSISEVDRFRVQIRRLELTAAKRVGAYPIRLKNRSRFGDVMDQLATGRPNLYRSQ